MCQMLRVVARTGTEGQQGVSLVPRLAGSHAWPPPSPFRHLHHAAPLAHLMAERTTSGDAHAAREVLRRGGGSGGGERAASGTGEESWSGQRAALVAAGSGPGGCAGLWERGWGRWQAERGKVGARRTGRVVGRWQAIWGAAAVLCECGMVPEAQAGMGKRSRWEEGRPMQGERPPRSRRLLCEHQCALGAVLKAAAAAAVSGNSSQVGLPLSARCQAHGVARGAAPG